MIADRQTSRQLTRLRHVTDVTLHRQIGIYACVGYSLVKLLLYPALGLPTDTVRRDSLFLFQA